MKNLALELIAGLYGTGVDVINQQFIINRRLYYHFDILNEKMKLNLYVLKFV